ncbi:hypothetical protein LOTGIDRAFT_163884 [Lottia gigantea]|uniref:Proline-rich transmembrane protein 1 n=1 Tax=Lottia gigantea TaxID=225164 RepID=V3ZHC4_LOTGI|nr:hypothetical protein LOTGIDRAFT_163884 [Lottia gigantea]ESO90663.1 hypothetical protein LOTGIDRAFT_163884 [Lottia gigantea]
MADSEKKAPPPSYEETAQKEYPHPQGFATQPGYNPVMQPTSTNIVIAENRPNDYLCLSIFTCLCCFWPTGIAAIFYSVKSRDAGNCGRITEAAEKGQTARKLAIISIVLGIIMTIIIIILRTVVFPTRTNRYYY